jgi:hypothetical protein
LRGSTGAETSSAGIFSDVSDNLSFTTGGATERLRIDSSGKVGIGTTSPADDLDVTGGIRGGSLKATSTLNSFASDGGVVIYKANAGIIRAHSNSGGGAYPLVFIASGSENARIDSSGRLLVGTSTSADARDFTKILISHGGTGADQNVGHVISCYATNDFSSGFIDFNKSNSGTQGTQTLVGTAEQLGEINFRGSDGAKFVTAASIKGETDAAPGTDDMPGRLVFSTTADGASSPTERMRITQAGYMLIGNISSLPSASVFGLGLLRDGTGGAIYSSRNNTSSTDHVEFFNPNGKVGSISTNASATAYNTSSDYRLKENVVPLTGAADRVNQLQVNRFNFIADPDKTVDGFIAHEAQAVVPECVTGTKDEIDDEGNPVYQGIDQSKLVPLLTAALQEAIAKIKTLEQRLSDAGIA